MLKPIKLLAVVWQKTGAVASEKQRELVLMDMKLQIKSRIAMAYFVRLYSTANSI